ncbi:MAG TPA: NAD(P)/FAD-dependent oxidoreductase [Thermoleophilaceae bacterium]|nr:NAD(P)/FAD-dependent oxidoreductase [Thermoleophilaceae bacterium]
MLDALVIGSGPNGLVAANMLAEAGWDVLVCEEQPVAGGAVRSGQVTAPGYTHDLFSAFYPLAIASPVMARLELDRFGLSWRRAGVVVAHPGEDGRTAAISTDLDETAASLDSFAPGDGDAWRRLYALWERVGSDLTEALFTPFPPVRAAARMLGKLGTPSEVARFARMGLLSTRRLGAETFQGHGGARLLAGNALHADLSPDSAAGGLYGWLLCSIGQELGWPVAEGGASALSGALLRRLEHHGGAVRTSSRVERVLVRAGRAVGVRLADGTEIEAQHVLADTSAPALYGELVEAGELPSGLLSDMDRFQWDNGTFKLNWALSGPVPWGDELTRRAGTVHVTEGVDSLGAQAGELEAGLIPGRPFLVLGQYASFDPTRAPDGAEAAWAYTHVPQAVRGDAGPDGLTGSWTRSEAERFADRMEEEVERLAPGFRESIVDRHLQSPADLQAANANLVNGALNSGTAQVHQQLVFRPTPGVAGPETPVAGLYLASASAHPGGGVHGGAGANAAAAALAEGSRVRRASRSALRALGRSSGPLAAAARRLP